MITILDNLCREFFGIGLDKVLAGYVGVVALWLSVETIKDIQTTKKLIAKKNWRVQLTSLKIIMTVMN